MEQRQNLAVIKKNDSCFVKPGICGRKKLIAQVELILKDGTRKIVCTSNENWLWVNGPTVFQNWYGGEDYDACLAEELIGKIPSEENGWAKAKKMQFAKGSAYCTRVSAKLGSRNALP